MTDAEYDHIRNDVQYAATGLCHSERGQWLCEQLLRLMDEKLLELDGENWERLQTIINALAIGMPSSVRQSLESALAS